MPPDYKSMFASFKQLETDQCPPAISGRVLQKLFEEIEKKNSWGKNELATLIARLCVDEIALMETETHFVYKGPPP